MCRYSEPTIYGFTPRIADDLGLVFDIRETAAA